jgi:vesicle transport protein SEC22
MVKMTMIARANDGLLLAASAEDETTERDVASYKQQTKAIFKSLSENNQPEAKCSVTTQGDYTFQ